MIRKEDFVDLFNSEGEFALFYRRALELDREQFNNWISKNFDEICTIKSFKEIEPEKSDIVELIANGYEHLTALCHYSSKAVSLLNSNYEYWTGFITIKDWDFSFASHSFNMKNNQIKDFSRLNTDLTLKYDFESLPHTYYGMNIPTAFIRHYESETLNNKSMNPLLVEWFLNNII